MTPEPIDVTPIIGVRFELDRFCSCKDKSTVTVIGAGSVMHAASLRCVVCNRHMGWLSRTVAEHLLETTKLFGRPDCIMRKPSPETVAKLLGASMAASIQHPLSEGESAIMTVSEDDYNKAYGSKYLSAADLSGETKRSRILDIQKGEFKEDNGATKTKLIATLEGIDKTMVLNQTNAGRLASARSRAPNSWIGLVVDLYTEETVMGEGVRLKVIKDTPKKAESQTQILRDDSDEVWKGD